MLDTKTEYCYDVIMSIFFALILLVFINMYITYSPPIIVV